MSEEAEAPPAGEEAAAEPAPAEDPHAEAAPDSATAEDGSTAVEGGGDDGGEGGKGGGEGGGGEGDGAEGEAEEGAGEQQAAEASSGEPPDGPAESGAANRESHKISRMQSVDPQDLPRSYSSNSPEELLVLEYVENFRRQFVQLYPDRKDLLLVPRNECGVEKFICTTVRPTQLEYSDIYDLEDCASFVAEHIQYEGLLDPVALPLYVPSPTSVLGWQIGDCIDMSIVLASLLIGVGYDAYVVIGYADRTTCFADETRVSLPFGSDGDRILRKVHKDSKSKGGGDDSKLQDQDDGLYAVPHRPPLDSHFVMKHEKMVRIDEKLFSQSQSIAGMPTTEEEAEEMSPDELDGQRFHCWVLVRAGKREMPEDVFVEASTGRVKSTDDPAYKGVEAVFNNQNYWVDMQRSAQVKDMTWDLDNFEKWEFIFLQSAVLAPGGGGGADDGASPPGSPLGHREKPAGGDAKAAEDHVTEQGAEEIHDSDHVLDLPPSWVQRLFIDRDVYLQRYSKEGQDVKRSTAYHKSRAELFAENSRKDGMVQKLTLYTNLARSTIVETTELFANRRDKLRKRVRHFKKGVSIDQTTPEALVEEFFDPGRPDALQKLEERPGGREYTLYHKATLDGMYKRVEKFTRNRDPKKYDALHKVMEFFEGHENRLTYRSITFEQPEPGSEPAPVKVQIENPKKMCLKFERDPEKDADTDLCKKTFYTGLRPSSKIHLIFHFGPGRITASTRTYITEKNINGDNFEMKAYNVDPFAKDMKYTEQRDEYQALVAEEKTLISEFKTAQREAEKMRETREKENKDPSLIKSLYVQLQDRKLAEADKPKEEDADVALKYDYLAPYLPKHSKNQALKKHDAQKAKDACLKALKDRLIDRAHIIETRLEEEQAALTKRQVGYQRQDNKGDKDSESEEYEKYVNEAQFKIQILKQRRDRHEDLAKAKFKEMIEKLQNDPRLAILNQ